MTRTIVLLGAGASNDAGLPLTTQLAERMVKQLNDRTGGRPTPEMLTLNFVYSAMMGHQGEDGSNPLRAVNVETLISAVRLLRAREDHEVAPFVSAWKPGVQGFSEPDASSSHGRALVSAIDKAIMGNAFADRDLVKVVAQIAREATNSTDAAVFERLEVLLLRSIQEQLGAIDSVDYLNPLAALARSQEGGLDVVTLNYDLSVEKMAANAGVPLDTGIDRWVAGSPLEFGPVEGGINLLKVHGSLDWALRNDDHFTNPPTIRVVETEPVEVSPHSNYYNANANLPWIVVGDREKLATDGPTLDLLWAAKQAFNRADHLLAVGYSFADDHINTLVRDWMAASEDRTLTVIDPGWPRPVTMGGLRSEDARTALAYRYGGSNDWNGTPHQIRIAVVPEKAGDALEANISLVPTTPETWADARWGPDTHEIVVKWLGTPLAFADISVISPIPVPGRVSVYSTRQERDDAEPQSPMSPVSHSAHFAPINQGDELSVFASIPEGWETPLQVMVHGEDPVGTRLATIDLPALQGAHPPGSSDDQAVAEGTEAV